MKKILEEENKKIEHLAKNNENLTPTDNTALDQELH